MNRSDEQLVAAAQGGDAAAYGELFTRYQSQIYNFALSLIGQSTDAKNIAQQAFINAYEALPRSKQVDFSVYLHRATHSLALDWQQTGKTTESAGEELSDIQRTATNLPVEMHAALILREIEMMSYREIAQALEVPKDSVADLLMEARTKFQEALKGPEEAQDLPEDRAAMLPRLSAYLDGELPEQDIKQVKTHLDSCAGCRRALQELTDASEAYREISPLAPPPALATDFFAALSEASPVEIKVEPDGENDLTMVMPKLDLEVDSPVEVREIPTDPWWRKLKTWGIIFSAISAIALGLFVGATNLGGDPETVDRANTEAVLETYDFGGGIQADEVPLPSVLEATRALEKTFESEDTSETTTTESAVTGSTTSDPTQTTTTSEETTSTGSTDATATGSTDTTSP